MTVSLSSSLPVGDQVARRGNSFSRAVARLCLSLTGWRLDGAVPNLPKMILIGAPHTSNMDGVIAIAILSALGLRSGTMIKDTAFKGAMGPVLRWFGAIPIDRKKAGGVVGQSVAAFNRADKLLLLIAPEGTRSSASEWKRGYWLIAANAEVPILPAAIDYVKKVVTFGPPLTTTADYDADFARLMAFYGAHSSPRHPERASAPICAALGLPFNPQEKS
ncbi:MAG: lysophospholipid acyltransferase family protein [Rhodoblastus sp.]